MVSVADQATVDWALATIRQRESGGNYTAKNGNSTASGAYQFINSTWRGLGGDQYAPTAREATPEQQDAIARAYVERILDTNGGRIDAIPRSWYVGNPNAADGYQPPGAGNEGFTVGRYVNGWMGTFNQVSNGQAQATSSGGTTGAMADSQTATDTRTPEEYAMQEYGYTAFYLNMPVVGDILRQAAAEKWSKETLKGALIKTDWWKSTDQAQRNWAQLESEDPQQAQSQVNGQTANIMARANQLGYPINRDRAEIIARDSLKNGWQGAELDGAIGADAGQVRLLTSSFGVTLRSTAKQYGVQLSDATLGDWAQRIASGKDTEENFSTYAREQAMNLYPTIAGYLQNGGTTEKYFDPYRERAAQVLGLNPETIDLSDPKWGAAFSMPDDQGNRRALSMDEWNKTLMSDDRYGFRYTENAQNMAEDMVGRIKKQMGVAA